MVDPSMRRIKGILLPLAFLFTWGGDASARPAVDAAVVPDYDYSQTRKIIFYGEDDYVVLAHPFDYPVPVMGALAYEIILLYASQFEDIVAPPEDPTHVMDLIMQDRYGERRIGQRLYLGDAWLSDGKSIAYLSPDDYRRLAGLLRDRYAGAEHYGSERLAGLRRSKANELPDDWLPEEASVTEAANRMGLNDRYPDHDPGGGNTYSDAHTEMDAAKSQAEENTDSVTVRASGTDIAARQSSSSSRVNGSSPEGESLDSELTVVTQSEIPEEASGWRPFLAVLALASVLLVWVLNRKQST